MCRARGFVAALCAGVLCLSASAAAAAGAPASSPLGSALVGYGNGHLVRYYGSSYGNQKQLAEGGGSPTVATDGRIASTGFNTLGIQIQNCNGTGVRQLTNPIGFRDEFPDFSPDGTQIVYTDGATRTLYLINADGSGTPEPLTTGGFLDQFPAFSPDGTTVAFFRNGSFSTQGLYLIDVATRQETRIVANSGWYPDWSPDGQKIVLVHPSPPGDDQIWAIDSDGSDGLDPFTGHPERRLTFPGSRKFDPEFSPSGNTLLFTSFSGSWVTQSIPLDGSPQFQISIPQLTGATWAPDSCDVDSPIVTFTTPSVAFPNWIFGLNESVQTAFSCSDEAGGSGVSSCVGDTTLNTVSLGWHTLTVTTSDNAGNTAPGRIDYYVYPDVARGPSPSLTTDIENDGATASDPVETTVTEPSGTASYIIEDSSGISGGVIPASQGAFVGGDATTSASPVRIDLTIDTSEVPSGKTIANTNVYGNGSLLPVCVGPPGTAGPDPCVSQRTTLAGGDFKFTVLASQPSANWVIGWPAGPVDADLDGIEDSIDTGTGTFQDHGTTAGTIGTLPVGYSVTVTDLPDPAGVHLVVTGTGTDPVPVTFTNPSTGVPCGPLELLPGSDVEVTCGSITVHVIAGSAAVRLSDDTTLVVDAGETAKIAIAMNGSFMVDSVTGGDGKVTVIDNGVSTPVGPSTTPVNLWDFVGFSQPVDNNGIYNIAKAGSTIPLKWRLLNENGTPITNLGGASVTVVTINCQGGAPSDVIEEVAASPSGLQNQGNGYYQLNWKTTKTWTACKQMRLSLQGEGPITHTANFNFR